MSKGPSQCCEQLTLALQSIRSGGNLGPSAWAQVHAAVMALAARAPKGVDIPAQDREDIVGQVVLKLLEKLEELPLDAGVPTCCKYVQVMLGNAYLTLARQRKRQRTAGPVFSTEGELLDPLDTLAAPDASNPFVVLERAQADKEIRERQESFQRVVDFVAEGRPARYRAQFLESWNQLAELVFEARPMVDLVRDDPDLPEQPEAADLVRVRNKLFQRHFRLRQDIADGIDAMQAAGHLEPLQADSLRKASLVLVRCQRVATTSVSKTRRAAAQASTQELTP